MRLIFRRRIADRLEWILVLVILFRSTLAAQTPRAIPASYAPSITRSAIKTWLAAAPNNDPNAITVSTLKDAQLVIAYVDGLGRNLQTVARQGSLVTNGTPKDLVSPHDYDLYGNEAVAYVPSPSTATDGTQNNGSFKLNPFAQQASFYSGSATDNPLLNQNETFFYGQSVFETSELNRVTEATSAGNSWSGSMYNGSEMDRKSAKIKYLTNTNLDAVRIWVVSVGAIGLFSSYSSPGAYSPGTLTKQIKIDENGHQKIEFRDKDNSVILTKVQVESTDDGQGSGHDGWACTYYLYDDLKNLRCVVQPEGVRVISGSWVLTDATILSEQCFRYEYDQRNRAIVKKVPGSAEVYTVYDFRNRVVMIQDGRQRGLNKWLVTLFDSQNRAEATGLVENGFSSGKTFAQHLSSAYTSSAYPFTTSSVPSATYWEELTRHFFDNYDWRSSYGNPLSANYATTWDGNLLSGSAWPYPQSNAGSTSTKGLVTGVKIKILGTSTYLFSINIYDYRGRLIQVQSQNTTAPSAVDVQTTQYDWVGHPIIYIVKQEKGNAPSQTSVLVKKYTYDELGRVIKEEIKVSNSLINGNAFSSFNPTFTIEYDALGRVHKKVLSPSFNSGTGLESMTYDYNIRGSILGINRANMSSPTNNNSFFCMDIAYDKTNSSVYNTTYVTPQYGGNIAGISWKSKGDPSLRKYDFTYDEQNRLLKADFNQLYGNLWGKSDPGNALTGLDYSTVIGDGSTAASGYDLNGNVRKMLQFGWKLGAGSGTLIDKMTFGYYPNSNRLQAVVDEVNDPQSSLGDFKTSIIHPQFGEKTISNIANVIDYSYDVNGSVTKDFNKNVVNVGGGDGITYNYLNLPEVVQFIKDETTKKGTITYTYDAQGTRLSKKIIEFGAGGMSVTTVQTYLLNCIYESRKTLPTADPGDYADKLLFITHEDGRIRFERATSSTCTAQSDRLVYDYFIKDHLGSVRAVVTEQKEDVCFIAATLEDARQTSEQKIYAIDDSRRVLKSSMGATQASFESKVYQTHGGLTGQKTGLGVTLKVMSGDQIKITAESFYTLPSGGGTGTVLNMVLSDLLTSFVGNAAVAGVKTGLAPTDVQSVSNNVSDLSTFMNRTPATYTPKAYLNWIFFDDQLKYVASAADPVGEGTAAGGQVYKQHTLFVNSPAIATKNGYLYVFVSNESDMPVYFDNLNITHSPGPLLEETHYYPGGLVMTGISDKAFRYQYPENKYRFDGGSELQNKEFSDASGLEMYETTFRMLDAQLGGRFWQQDPLAMTLFDLSPYQYATNNPLLFNDPLGLDTVRVQGDGSHKVMVRKGDVLAWTTGGSTSYYTYDPDNKEAVNGFVGGGIDEGTMETATVTSPSQHGDNATPWRVGAEWITGSGPREHHFRGADPFTRKLSTHEHIEDTRNMIAGMIEQGSRLPLEGNNKYDLGGIAGVPKYLRDYSTLLSFGASGNIAVTYLGSYELSYEVLSIDEDDGTARVHFKVLNYSTIESATHPPVIGYTPFWSQNIGKPLNSMFSTGPLSATSQTFDWNETIKWK